MIAYLAIGASLFFGHCFLHDDIATEFCEADVADQVAEVLVWAIFWPLFLLS